MDIAYLLVLQKIREATLGIGDSFFLSISGLAESGILFYLLCIVYWALSKRAGTYLFLSWQSCLLLNNFLKIICCVNRPWVTNPEVHPVPAALPEATGYSFPSGTTTSGAAVYGAAAYYNRHNKLARNALIILALLIGFSRNYLGVHRPQDVIVALVLSSLVVFLLSRVLAFVEAHPEKDVLVLVFLVVIGVVVLLVTIFKSYPENVVSDGKVLVDTSSMARGTIKTVGAMLGCYLGWFCERRWVHFSTEGTLTTKIMRVAFGLFILLFLRSEVYTVLKLFLDKKTSAFIGEFVACFFCVAVWPWCFTRYEKRKQSIK